MVRVSTTCSWRYGKWCVLVTHRLRFTYTRCRYILPFTVVHTVAHVVGYTFYTRTRCWFRVTHGCYLPDLRSRTLPHFGFYRTHTHTARLGYILPAPRWVTSHAGGYHIYRLLRCTHVLRCLRCGLRTHFTYVYILPHILRCILPDLVELLGSCYGLRLLHTVHTRYTHARLHLHTPHFTFTFADIYGCTHARTHTPHFYAHTFYTHTHVHAHAYVLHTHIWTHGWFCRVIVGSRLDLVVGLLYALRLLHSILRLLFVTFYILHLFVQLHTHTLVTLPFVCSHILYVYRTEGRKEEGGRTNIDPHSIVPFITR